MGLKPLQSRKQDREFSVVSVSELVSGIEGWMADSEYRQISKQTLSVRRVLMGKFLWWVRQQEILEVGTREIRGFLAYLTTAHERPEGRFGTNCVHRHHPLRPATIANYYNNLRILFNFLVEEAVIEASPMAQLKPPRVPQDQVQPFTEAQVLQILQAAARTRQKRRDVALCYFLLDTGTRAGEVVTLKMSHFNAIEGYCKVLGKGNKSRRVFLSPPTRRAIASYLRIRGRDEDDFLFLSDDGEPLTVNGLRQVVERWGKAAGFTTEVRCSPHTFRHTFAVSFLRQGGNGFSLQQFLGHTRMTMTQRYVALASADLANAHRQASPVQALLKKGSRL